MHNRIVFSGNIPSQHVREGDSYFLATMSISGLASLGLGSICTCGNSGLRLEWEDHFKGLSPSVSIEDVNSPKAQVAKPGKWKKRTW